MNPAMGGAPQGWGDGRPGLISRVSFCEGGGCSHDQLSMASEMLLDLADSVPPGYRFVGKLAIVAAVAGEIEDLYVAFGDHIKPQVDPSQLTRSLAIDDQIRAELKGNPDRLCVMAMATVAPVGAD